MITTPRKIKTTALITALVTTLISSAAIWAQPIDPWLADGLNKQIQQNQTQQGAVASGPSAAEIRAWQQREAEVQARIAKHRATPWYMAIIFNTENKKFAWDGGYSTPEKAVQEAMKFCTSSCQVVLVFHNACAVMTNRAGGIHSLDNIFFGIHPDDKQAAEISIKKCEAVHGEGNCRYSDMKTMHGTAFCTGYDYGVYGH